MNTLLGLAALIIASALLVVLSLVLWAAWLAVAWGWFLVVDLLASLGMPAWAGLRSVLAAVLEAVLIAEAALVTLWARQEVRFLRGWS